MSDDDLDDEPDPFLRPLWDDEPEEADLAGAPLLRPVWDGDPDALPRPAPRPRAVSDAGWLLAPLAAAQDALARLDAAAAAAPAPLRQGFVSRLSLREASGYLASQGAFVHPTDLALRAAGLTGRFDTALQRARPETALPNSRPHLPEAWDPADLSTLSAFEQAAIRALGLARLLAALPRAHDPLADPSAAATVLGPLFARDLDPVRFRAWRARLRRRPSPAIPALLRAADAALDWMEAGIVDEPDPIQALAIAALLLARTGTLQAVPLPVWTGFPGVGRVSDGGLPRLAPAATRRLGVRGEVGWRGAFLGLVAESARAGLRELGWLSEAAASGSRLAAARDRRSTLGQALEAVLAAPVITPSQLADQLRVTQQAARRLLGILAEAGIVREVTGRGSFRAYAV